MQNETKPTKQNSVEIIIEGFTFGRKYFVLADSSIAERINDKYYELNRFSFDNRPYVELFCNEVGYRLFSIAKIVSDAFLKDEFGRWLIPKDGDLENCNSSNLEWVMKKEHYSGIEKGICFYKRDSNTLELSKEQVARRKLYLKEYKERYEKKKADVFYYSP